MDLVDIWNNEKVSSNYTNFKKSILKIDNSNKSYDS